MSRVKRIENIITGLVLIFCAVFLIRKPEHGYDMVLVLLSVSFAVYGLKQLIYYFMMARYMVGGKVSFYQGIILFDFGLFTFNLASIPEIYILLYLIAVNFVSGIIDIAGAIDKMKSGATNWKLGLAEGIISVLAVVFCVIFRHNHNMMVYIYCAGIIQSALLKIVSAFRKTAIVYI